MPVKVLVIGSTGMLGGAVISQLRQHGIASIESSRTKGLLFDAQNDRADALLESSGLAKGDFVVNCVGLTKARINEEDALSIERAIRLNVLFPIELARAADQMGVKVIQVATDCVYSGLQGNYLESSSHDALDAYGKTKSLGEVRARNVMHLRCSLIGPENLGRKSLFFEWVRGLNLGASVKGYKNHMWNGLTSQTFARIVVGIVKSELFSPGLHHLVPNGVISKFDLIRLELEMLGRTDVKVEEFFASSSIDRTLATKNPHENFVFFARAGYQSVPTIREMLEELPWDMLKESAF